jgi:hypothetical protein
MRSCWRSCMESVFKWVPRAFNSDRSMLPSGKSLAWAGIHNQDWYDSHECCKGGGNFHVRSPDLCLKRQARSTRHLCERRFDRLTPIARYSRQCRADKMMAPVPAPSVRSKNYSSQVGIISTQRGLPRHECKLARGPGGSLLCWLKVPRRPPAAPRDGPNRFQFTHQ